MTIVNSGFKGLMDFVQHEWHITNYCRRWPGAVVKALCLESQEISGSNPTLTFKFQRNKMFFPRSLVEIQYCGEPS